MTALSVSHRPLDPRPEWLTPFPAEWLVRLRQISPIVEQTSHLIPRWREDSKEWWLYQALPVHLLSPDRIQQLAVHWSDLPTHQQQGRKVHVTAYQFWMFHTHRVDVTPFWILQGSKFIRGGTPFAFTDRERRILDAEGLEGEPVPPGTLPNIPFDEDVVQAILARDRLYKVGGDLDRLMEQQTAAGVKAEDEATEQEFRRVFLKYHAERMQPQVEFMKFFRHRPEYEDSFRPAPKGLANDLSVWRDQFIQTGQVGVGVPASRSLQIAVK